VPSETDDPGAPSEDQRERLAVPASGADEPFRPIGTFEEAFGAAYPRARKLLVGGDGIAVEEFLERPVEHWLKPSQTGQRRTR
jgi:hypothetical protein